MTAPAKKPLKRLGLGMPVEKDPVDPYGQAVVFNGRHVARDDYEGVRLGPDAVHRDEPEWIECRHKRAQRERIAAYGGLPVLIAVAIVDRIFELGIL